MITDGRCTLEAVSPAPKKAPVPAVYSASAHISHNRSESVTNADRVWSSSDQAKLEADVSQASFYI